ncbi:MAG: hypothetical protein WCO26_01470 [Deltaproteobacteria bacterium]
MNLAELRSWELIGLIASFTTFLSFAGNIIQFFRNRTQRKLFYSKVFADYNHMYRLAILADRCKENYADNSSELRLRFENTIRCIEQITGIADSVRQEALAYSERFLKKPLFYQRPHQPDPKIAKGNWIQSLLCRADQPKGGETGEVKTIQKKGGD